MILVKSLLIKIVLLTKGHPIHRYMKKVKIAQVNILEPDLKKIQLMHPTLLDLIGARYWLSLRILITNIWKKC